MTSTRPFAAFRHPDFRRYELARLADTIGLQMQSVAVGWQVYEVTRRPLDLGFVGLVQFLPLLLLVLLAGHVADLFDRRRILIVYNLALVLGALVLVWLTEVKALEKTGLWPMYCVLAWLGTARAFAGPANQALLPSLVPLEDVANALTWNSGMWQTATIIGPALGGVIYACPRGAEIVYGCFGLLALLALWALARMEVKTTGPSKSAATWKRLLAGVAYVRAQPVLLGAISLDLFAVLLGGAVALLPIFAKDVLQTGPLGLGLLRSAPAFGAALMAIFLAFKPLAHRAGKTMLACVAIFGVATCVFGMSRNLYLSLAALVVIGASDLVSVFVRQTLIQIRTPPEMRGRVSAVNQVFVGASNELGEFESGITAHWFGAKMATILGGLGTLLVVGLWSWMFPALRDTDELVPNEE